MKSKESILHPVKRTHGVYLDHRKHTAEMETVTMPPPKQVVIPLSQHIGAPVVPTVQKGDEVFVGTKIGEVPSFVSAPVHSSVSGTVTDIGEKMTNGRMMSCITIESDGKMTPDPSLKPFPVKTAADIVAAAKECGLVGLGGAGFPTHVKLTPNEKTPIDTLILNAAECEPYLTADYRECMEKSEDIIEAIYLLKEKMNLKQVILCVESNKPDAIRKLYVMATDRRDPDDQVKVMKLPSSYPQGAEKVIIYSATGRIVPPGKLPADVGCIVMNVASIASLYRFIQTGMPLVQKRITVDGDAVTDPKNIAVPIGTSVRDVLEFAGIDPETVGTVLFGGPMMGNAAADFDAVIEKRTNGLTLFKESEPPRVTPCIRCGRCASVCPMNLYPAMVESAYRIGEPERYEKLNVNYCMECGSCAFVCPAKRPLTQVMRIAKAELRRKPK